MSHPARPDTSRIRPSRQSTARQNIWAEVKISDEQPVGLPRPYEQMPQVPGWDKEDVWEDHLEQSFRRGRTVLEALRYGDRYWVANHCLRMPIDKTSSPDLHPVAHLGMQRLLQIIVLSRVPIRPVDSHWNMPKLDDIFSTVGAMRAELGVTSEIIDQAYNEHPSYMVPTFPGISGAALVDSIISGQLQVGNPEQPTPALYQP